MEIVDVPGHFRTGMPFNYPAHQRGLLIEEYVCQHLIEKKDEINTELVYLPILWTSFRCRNGGGNSEILQNFYDSLPKDKTYFTIVQYDDGTGINMPNCIVFSCCGNNPSAFIDLPIPVLCDRHYKKRNEQHTYLASFIGRLSATVRPTMFSELQGKEGFFIQESADNTTYFVDTLRKSLFALCPRGYGITSFRMYEAMELGCIPIYIVGDNDKHWLPFVNEIDWNRLGIILKESQIPFIEGIIKNMSQGEIADKLAYVQECYEKYFTLAGAAKTIENIIKTNLK